MTTGFVFALLTIVLFLVFQRRSPTSLFALAGNIVLAAILSVALIAGYRYADKRGFIPRAISSEVRDTVREIQESGRSTAHDLR